MPSRAAEVVDGLERTAMVEEARGNHTVTADYFRNAAKFTQTHPGYDHKMTEYYATKAAELESSAKSPDSDPDH